MTAFPATALALAAAFAAPIPDMPEAEASSLHIDINIPALELIVYENDEVIETYRVAVGLKGAYTPPGSYTVDHAEWNPWWRPPPDREWTRDRVVTPPGPNNPMGRVKLFFSPLYFIHGTPEAESIGQPASRGCVRMLNEDAIALARLVHEYANPTVPADQVDRILSRPGDTRHVRFRAPPTLEIRYEPVVVEGDELVIYPDLYDLGRIHRESVIQALLAAGIDTAGVDRGHIRHVIERSREEDGIYRVALSEAFGDLAALR